MALIAKLKLIAPELSQLPDETLEAYIELAQPQVGPKLCNRDLVVAYLAAHMATIAGRSGAGGAVASKSEGGLSISFGATGASAYDTTSYGQEYKRLVRLCVFSARNRMVRGL